MSAAAPPSAALAPALLVRWRNYLDISGTPVETSWDAFFAELAAPAPAYVGDRTQPGWSPVVCSTPLRKDANVTGLSALVLDYDQGATLEEARASWQDAFGLIHTTRKHAPDGHRFRVVLPLSRVVTPDEHGALWAWANDVAERHLDSSTKNPSRFWYLPGVHEGGEFVAIRLDGTPLDVNAILSAWKPGASAPAPVSSPFGDVPLLDRIKRASRYLERVDAAVAGQGGHDKTWDAALKVIVGFDLPAAVGLDLLLREYNPRCQPPWSRRELEHKVAGADRDARHQRGFLLNKRPPRASAAAARTTAPFSSAPREPGLDVEATTAPAPPGGTGGAPPPPPDIPGLVLAKNGRAVNDYSNIAKIVRGLYGGPEGGIEGALTMNEMTVGPTLKEGDAPERPLKDTDLSRMRERICSVFRLNSGADNLREAVCQVADERRFHPVKRYIAELEWDGELRIARVAKEVLGIEQPTDLTQRMLRCWFIAAVARALDPGVKVDNALVLTGKQNLYKSTFFRILGGQHFADTKMDISSKDGLMQLAAAWIYEWSELENVTSAKEAAEVKAFCTSSHDTYRPPFARGVIQHPRSSVIVGTTNKDQFLNDPTGSRRFWVIRVTQHANRELLQTWRDMLWAEARLAYEGGEKHFLSVEEEEAREIAAEEHTVEDALHAAVARWIRTEAARIVANNQDGFVTTGDILRGALNLEPGRWDRGLQIRVGHAMHRLGWVKDRPMLHGLRTWAFRQKGSDLTM